MNEPNEPPPGFYASEPPQAEHFPPHNPPPFRPTSALAVWSLVNGLLGWLFCPVLCSMIAVVTGHMALGEIQRLTLDGKGLAIAGLILGYSMLVCALLATLAIAMFVVWAGGVNF